MGLFDSFFGSSKNVTTTRPQVMEGLEPLVPQLSKLAQQAYGRPYQAYTAGSRLAPFSRSQQAGMRAFQGIATDPSYQRGMGQAGEAIGSSMEDQNMQSMIRSLGRSIKPERTQAGMTNARGWTDPGTAASYMDPYKSNVIDQYLNREDKRTGQRRAGLDAKLAGKKAFGSRGDIGRAQFESDEEDRKAEAIANLMDKGYESGANIFRSDADRGLTSETGNVDRALTSSTGNANRAMTAEQLMTQGLGQGVTGENTRLAGRRAAGNDLAQLTDRYRTGMTESAKNLMNVGQMEQTQAQKPLDLQYQDWMRQQNFPAEQATGLSRIVYGAPTGSTTTAPGPSGASQLLGAGIGAYGLGSGMGWWKRGGKVAKLAGGGDPLSEISDFEAMKALDPREAAWLQSAAPHVQKARINDMKRKIYLNRFKHGAPSNDVKFQRQPSYDDQTAQFMSPGTFGGAPDPRTSALLDQAQSGGMPPTTLDLEANDETQASRRFATPPRIGPDTGGDTTGGEYAGIGGGYSEDQQTPEDVPPMSMMPPPVGGGPRGIGASAGPMTPDMRLGRDDAAPASMPTMLDADATSGPGAPANDVGSAGGDSAADPYSGLLAKLVEAQDPKASRGMILAKLGAAMASSRQPGFLGPVGEGIGAAAQGMENEQQRRLRALGQAASIEERRQAAKDRSEDRKRADQIRKEDLAERGADRKQQIKLAEDKLAETKRQFDLGKVGEADLRAAQTDLARARADAERTGKDRSTYIEREIARHMEEDPTLTRSEARAIVTGEKSKEGLTRERLTNQREEGRRKYISEATMGGMRPMTAAQRAEEEKLYGPRPDRSGAPPTPGVSRETPNAVSPAAPTPAAPPVAAKPQAGAPQRPPSVPPAAQYSPSKKSWWWQEGGVWKSAPGV